MVIPYGHQLIDDSDISSVVEALKSDWITQGKRIEQFEKSLSKFVGAKYTCVVANGTCALHAACIAAGIGPGDEVIVPALTFVASANCVLYCGAKPVLCDVYPDTITIDVEQAQKKITQKTRAIIAVDFAGHPADWDKLKKLAGKYHLILIDDASHALGSVYKGRRIGSIADLTTFSFHPVKAITTGEGGAVATNEKRYFETIKKIRHHGISRPKESKSKGGWYYDVDTLGYNFRMTDIQAALGASQLKKIDSFIQTRRKIWGIYQKQLRNVDGVSLPVEKKEAKSAWHLFPIRMNSKNRKRVFDKMRKDGIGVQVHYIPIHFFSLYRKDYKIGDFPIAESYYHQALSLPLYAGLQLNEQMYVIESLKKALR
ncbi:UDP-4-amino-4,6-dideoxy-N-acetyl-beta-L-altrosamine transaminase [Candidatus Curtissbacteria bacterium RIFCSPHIGHO2_02_FULL_40_17]|uniref:UDP-4-amino-4, 6-dideoxy-N-acetyl-beta-L-altrosamine transaminase n=2 Tax=Candidatus Curtissiibacteriota TaxID=1752717 RepID=A0A1F5GHP2_9BACT|nr:MAG: UDP-4-amino-4,6-dideoxy-N-acetyl-beta-L-altrosamine transaminase [Candidatus Curtissbacteria bacterium RIFCSPHIGHO2_02_FULL_40_17]OGE04047.1 MAG: UDP-4-amino-4,6-dideoxy-N-acetyl-beta-L-altrosamine transaminase [Candidatus Curtissbacteria bacterium RIFCSPHIGHO2_12_FULL_41_17]